MNKKRLEVKNRFKLQQNVQISHKLKLLKKREIQKRQKDEVGAQKRQMIAARTRSVFFMAIIVAR